MLLVVDNGSVYTSNLLDFLCNKKFEFIIKSNSSLELDDIDNFENDDGDDPNIPDTDPPRDEEIVGVGELNPEDRMNTLLSDGSGKRFVSLSTFPFQQRIPNLLQRAERGATFCAKYSKMIPFYMMYSGFQIPDSSGHCILH